MTKTIKALAVLGVVAGLGIAALPIAGASATVVTDGEGSDTKDGIVATDTTFSLTLDDKLSITTNASDVTLAPETGVTYAGQYTGADMTVTVETRNSKGYQLTMIGSAGTDQNNATVVNGLTNEKGDVIAAGDLTGTTSTWGYKVATNILGTTVAAPEAWTGVANADGASAIIMESDKPTLSDGDVATLTFGAKIVDGQAAGTYKGKVTFTATNLPKASN